MLRQKSHPKNQPAPHLLARSKQREPNAEQLTMTYSSENQIIKISRQQNSSRMSCGLTIQS
jgi:hypothetical protein